MTTGMDTPSSKSCATMQPTSAALLLIERSIPPVSTTAVKPELRINSTLVCRSTVIRLSAVKKERVIRLEAMTTNTSTETLIAYLDCRR